MVLKTQTIAIMGGASGIGLEIANSALKANAKVIATASSQKALEDAQKQHPKINWHLSNFASTESRKAIAQTIIEAKPNFVIFNQAIVEYRDFTKPADPHIPPIWLEVQDNFTAPMEITQTLTGALFSHDMRIGFVTTSPSKAGRGMQVYLATQAGISAFINALRAELSAARSNIGLSDIRLPFASEFPKKTKTSAPPHWSALSNSILHKLIEGQDDIDLN